MAFHANQPQLKTYRLLRQYRSFFAAGSVVAWRATTSTEQADRKLSPDDTQRNQDEHRKSEPVPSAPAPPRSKPVRHGRTKDQDASDDEVTGSPGDLACELHGHQGRHQKDGGQDRDGECCAREGSRHDLNFAHEPHRWGVPGYASCWPASSSRAHRRTVSDVQQTDVSDDDERQDSTSAATQSPNLTGGSQSHSGCRRLSGQPRVRTFVHKCDARDRGALTCSRLVASVLALTAAQLKLSRRAVAGWSGRGGRPRR
jgi:hypothetical protein